MASIHRTSDRQRYEVRWRDLEGKQRSRRVPNKKTAEQLKRQIEEAHALGRDWAPGAAPVRHRLKDALQAYVDDRARTVRAPHLHRIDTVLTRFVLAHPEGVGVGLDGMSRRALSAFWDVLVADGVNISTARKYMAIVGKAWGWLADHDTYGDDTPRPRKIEMPKSTPSKAPRAPTWAQVDELLAMAEARGEPEWVIRLIIIQRCTGLRSGQVLQLTWADVDLDEARLTIRPELGKSPQEQQGRVVPMAAALVPELRAWGPGSGRIVRPHMKSPHVRIRRLWERSSVPRGLWATQPLHALRKAFTTGLVSHRVPTEAVKALIGHSVGDVTFGHYVDPEALRWCVDLVPPLRVVDELAKRREGAA